MTKASKRRLTLSTSALGLLLVLGLVFVALPDSPQDLPPPLPEIRPLIISTVRAAAWVRTGRVYQTAGW